MLDYFIDPILRGPTLGSIFLCIAAGLVGAVVFLQKRSLIGESLSHAAYPGVLLSLLLAPEAHPLAILFGAFITAFLSYGLFVMLHQKVTKDTALCFTLASFFGFGIFLLSFLQFQKGNLAKLAESYLFGQAATMTDTHIYLFFALASLISLLFILFYKELQLYLFDPEFAKSLGVPVRTLSIFLNFLLTLSIVCGIRSCGVVLMSGILVAPAVAARQLTKRFAFFLCLSPLLGALSAFLGCVTSHEWTKAFASVTPRLVLPTGPMIILSASFFCLLSLFFAKERGLIMKMLRQLAYTKKQHVDHILKLLWKKPRQTFDSLQTTLLLSSRKLQRYLKQLQRLGLIQNKQEHYLLTPQGVTKAEQIIRLHRLWEVYLVTLMNQGKDVVHENAEEMEHVLTPEMERELTLLLDDPKIDPHKQPIPKQRPASMEAL